MLGRGVEILGLPLPKIVVVGDQVPGSFLIEGISEIKVPRHAGACTRSSLTVIPSGTVRSRSSQDIIMIASYLNAPPKLAYWDRG